MKQLCMGWRTRALGVTVLLSAVAVTGLLADTTTDWPMFGRSLDNAATVGSSISVQNINNLKPKWSLTTNGDVSARATVANGVAYFPDWGPPSGGSSTLWAVSVGSGRALWSRSLADYGLTGNKYGLTFQHRWLSGN